MFYLFIFYFFSAKGHVDIHNIILGPDRITDLEISLHRFIEFQIVPVVTWAGPKHMIL